MSTRDTYIKDRTGIQKNANGFKAFLSWGYFKVELQDTVTNGDSKVEI